MSKLSKVELELVISNAIRFIKRVCLYDEENKYCRIGMDESVVNEVLKILMGDEYGK